MPSDSFVGRRHLERTEANEDQEGFFSHHRCSAEVGNLSWHQSLNDRDKHRYRTIMMAMRVLGIVAHRGPVSSRFSSRGEYLSVDSGYDFYHDSATCQQFPRVDAALGQL